MTDKIESLDNVHNILGMFSEWGWFLEMVHVYFQRCLLLSLITWAMWGKVEPSSGDSWAVVTVLEFPQFRLRLWPSSCFRLYLVVISHVTKKSRISGAQQHLLCLLQFRWSKMMLNIQAYDLLLKMYCNLERDRFVVVTSKYFIWKRKKTTQTASSPLTLTKLTCWKTDKYERYWNWIIEWVHSTVWILANELGSQKYKL